MEHALQKTIVAYLRRCNIFCFETDVMDGLKFCKNQQTRMAFINHHKAMGFVKGQPDLILITPSGKVVFVELKDGKNGRHTKEQKQFKGLVEWFGLDYLLWRSFDECVDYVKKIKSL